MLNDEIKKKIIFLTKSPTLKDEINKQKNPRKDSGLIYFIKIFLF